MCMADATWTTTTFCRKCKKLRGCLETNNITEYRFLCTECARESSLISNCNSCGCEGLKILLDKQGGYCWKCQNDNIYECVLCGKELYTQNINDGVCKNCETGKNRSCLKCGNYISAKKLNSEGLCEKCTIKIYNVLKDSKVNEIVECIECGRECYINDLHNGLCIYCYSEGLEKEIIKINKRVKIKKAYNR